MSNQKRIFLGLSIVIILILILPIRRCWDIDACVDRGGRWNYETGKCEFFQKTNIMSVTLIGRELTSRYSVTMDVASPDALTAAQLALEHARRLGYAIVGVREIKVGMECDTYESPQVLKVHEKLFPEDPSRYD